MADRTTENG